MSRGLHAALLIALSLPNAAAAQQMSPEYKRNYYSQDSSLDRVATVDKYTPLEVVEGGNGPALPMVKRSAIDPAALATAMAQIDAAAGSGGRTFYAALFAAGYRPELHYYLRGGHGFGMTPLDSTSDHFTDEVSW